MLLLDSLCRRSVLCGRPTHRRQSPAIEAIRVTGHDFRTLTFCHLRHLEHVVGALLVNCCHRSSRIVGVIETCLGLSEQRTESLYSSLDLVISGTGMHTRQCLTADSTDLDTVDIGQGWSNGRLLGAA